MKGAQNNTALTRIMNMVEVLFPMLMHFFDLSIVEMITNGRLLYSVESDFNSILFIFSISMIFQYIRKKKNDDLSRKPLQMSLIVSLKFSGIYLYFNS